jgi:hypothetical protein
MALTGARSAVVYGIAGGDPIANRAGLRRKICAGRTHTFDRVADSMWREGFGPNRRASMLPGILPGSTGCRRSSMLQRWR